MCQAGTCGACAVVAGAHLQFVRFLGQFHAEPVSLGDLGVELLDLGIQFLPLVLRLGLDLLQHLHLTRQLLVVCLQALLVLLQICFELGGGREKHYLITRHERHRLLVCRIVPDTVSLSQH